ncbi:MAG TPA: phosphoribulokinase [Methanoregulaceae archaeon]|nr:phosphoribulokinase [Methanoregulaceae archaeon]
MTPRQNFKDIIASSSRVFAIGVAGDSGSGKTTFTNAIRQIFGSSLVDTITLDDYHIYNREQRSALGITPLDPQANALEKLENDIRTLKAGTGIHKNIYNHSTGLLEGPVYLPPARILILEGLHTLYSPGLRDLLDFSIYVDPAAAVTREWKIKRDMKKRGYSKREVSEEISRRMEDYHAYIAPQRKYADVVIEIGFSKYGRDLGWARNIYRITLVQSRLEKSLGQARLDIDLLPLLTSVTYSFMLEFRAIEKEGRQMGALTFDGEIPHDIIRRLERTVERQTGISPINIRSGTDPVTATDIARLMISWMIINRRIFLENETGTC